MQLSEYKQAGLYNRPDPNWEAMGNSEDIKSLDRHKDTSISAVNDLEDIVCPVDEAGLQYGKVVNQSEEVTNP